MLYNVLHFVKKQKIEKIFLCVVFVSKWMGFSAAPCTRLFSIV